MTVPRSRPRAAWRAALFATAALLPAGQAAAQNDVADVRAKEYRLGDDDRLRYVLIGASDPLPSPEAGYKVLLVLPGGDGGADFTPFVKRIYKRALDNEYLVVQLIAPKWNDGQRVVWPKRGDRVRGMKTPVEQFAADAVEHLAQRTRLDARHVFVLGWSSGGPAAYAISMADKSPVTGAFAAMSVFNPDGLPPLRAARGHAYFLLHSPQDNMCPFWMARQAEKDLADAGARVQLVTYEGGHGWRGDVFGNIRGGVKWLETQTSE